ncbi:MAG: ParA family protein [Anaerolineae bacterium]|nr:MAG: ParA family protein [Anaerolineae bacterium]
MPYKIAVANEKGGVAKTTSVVSLAGALVEMGHRVLVVDLDPQANLTLALGLKPKDVTHSVAQVLLNSLDPKEVIRTTEVENLDLLPSNAEMGLAERFLPVRQSYDTILRSSLSNNLPYDYILFDCPPALGAITLNAITAADMLVIPTQAEYFSAYALKSMMSAIRKVRDQSNPNLNYRVFITMYDRRNRTHRTLLEQLQTTFGNDGLLETIIETDTKLRESPIVGIPIMYYVSRTRSAEQYRALAQELIHDVEKIKVRTAA